MAYEISWVENSIRDWFASVAWSRKGKVTRRERFLGEMNAVIPWQRLIALIEPHYQSMRETDTTKS